jgi:S1-C subfamily serine protease
MNRQTLGTCLSVVMLIVAFLLGGTLGGLVGGGLALWIAWEDPTLLWGEPTPTPLASLTAIPDPRIAIEPTSPPTPTPTVPQVVAQVAPAVVTVVSVQSLQPQNGTLVEPRALGSGIVVDGRGYVLTNFHVVESAQSLQAILSNGLLVQATLLESDRTQDLAFIKIGKDNLPVVRWGDASGVQPGEEVVAIGSALGDFPNTVTLGVVSAINRSLDIGDGIVIRGLIQTDAAINRGNSGGPLVNMRGEVVGINTFIIRGTTNNGLAEGIGFAIPSSTARQAAEKWIAIHAGRQ